MACRTEVIDPDGNGRSHRHVKPAMRAPIIGATRRRHVVDEEKGTPKAQTSMRWDSSLVRPPMSPDANPVSTTAATNRIREMATSQTLLPQP
jgi:hypothetical protein